jgi:hypothetical protein
MILGLLLISNPKPIGRGGYNYNGGLLARMYLLEQASN